MARTTGSDGEKTEAAIREAATALIAHHGYEATSMRQLAAEVGVQAAAWGGTHAHAGSPAARLSAFVGNHIAFHIERRHSTHISNMELRSLSPERLTRILKLRGAYEKELRAILRDGAETGAFDLDDVGLTAMALIQMMTGVIVWFRPGERLSVAGVTETYLAMTMRLVGATTGREEPHVHQHAELRA